MTVDISTVKQAIDKTIRWAWAGTSPNGIWSRTMDNAGFSTSWTDSSELLYPLLLVGVEPNDERMKKAVTAIKNGFSGTHEQGHFWREQYQRFRKHMYVGLVLISAGERDSKEFQECYSALARHRVGKGGWTDGEPLEANIYNTCLALEFLSRGNIDHQALEEGRRWLASAQYRDGGWGWWIYERSNPTCTAIATMHLLNTNYHEAAERGIRWLLRTRRVKDEGRWPLVYEPGGDQDGSLISMLGHADNYIHFSTAHAARTLLMSGMDMNSDAIQDAVKYLLAIQKPQGGWAAVGWERQYSPCDKTIPIVYFTGHALLALHEYVVRASK